MPSTPKLDITEEERMAASARRKMAIVEDLTKPMDMESSPLACSLVQPPRPAPKTSGKWPKPSRPNKKSQTRDDYFNNTATKVPNTFGPRNLKKDKVSELLPGRVWVVPNVLTDAECESFIRGGEAYGIGPALKASGAVELRTNGRTDNYCAPELSAMVNKRLPDALLQQLEQTRPGTAFRGIHPNWRIARYREGEFFAAHYDQADSLTVKDPTSSSRKARFDSFHTLLISLSDRRSFQGGSTRFFPEGRYDDSAIDVELPRGWAIVFDHNLLHAGLPPTSGAKYIAQAGLLRGDPQKVVGAVSTFTFGPGLEFV